MSIVNVLKGLAVGIPTFFIAYFATYYLVH